MWFVLRIVAFVLVLCGAWSLSAVAHPSLDRSVSFDLDRKFDISVQFDQRNPKSGHLDFSEDDETGVWSLQATPSKYHGPEGIDASGLFVDRDGALDSYILKALRKGWLPLVRSLDSSEDDDGNQVFAFEFATPVQISQLITGRGSGDSADDDSPTLSFYSDIAGTNLVTPFSYYQNCNEDHGAITLVVPEVRRIVVASNALSPSQRPSSNGSGSGGTDVPEPASALLLLPGVALLTAIHRRRRTAIASRAPNADDGTDSN